MKTIGIDSLNQWLYGDLMDIIDCHDYGECYTSKDVKKIGNPRNSTAGIDPTGSGTNDIK